MTETKVLLVGESWATSATHYKGFDQFGSVTFHLGAEPLVAALRDSPYALTYMPAHEAAEGFPFTAEGLAQYDVILLSDIGANTLLLPPEVWLRGKPVPNRLKLIRDWTAKGGGLAMIGGYFSFQGIDGKARWRRTPVEEALPVECLPCDDRIEVPDGFVPEIAEAHRNHPIFAGLDLPMPLLLGANEVVVKPGAEVLARLPAEEGGHPLLVTGRHGEGRTLAWTSDIGPHWLPQPFVDWPGYKTLWRNTLGWLAGRN
ncbi:glutamine amidotransferase [Roseomonas haemaphysalidis]|uniref:Cytoplasmic protein n=1 Tax=Roseomonas haemaphysalidis TaxID=2768162 RepID=A0ABS3KLG2_9PROT|nr:glutamine amidotransferase [Roseomonas haemaphysalidis]MBO1078304.1 cytoplasmic protein [Roseomonas haemaphysalidis]